jgi:uncharacterized membrane protein HdeD (DUF308 family)
MSPRIERRMSAFLSTALLARGALGVVVGLVMLGLPVLAALLPRVTTGVMLVLFGGYVVLDGLLTVAAGIRGTARYDRVMLVQGLVGLVAGAVSLFVPIGSPVLLYLLAAWAIVAGAIETLAARLMRQESRVGILRLSGGASVILGLLLIVGWPPGLVRIVILLAAYSLVAGIVRAMAGIR